MDNKEHVPPDIVKKGQPQFLSPNELHEALCVYCNKKEVLHPSFDLTNMLWRYGYDLEQAKHFIDTRYEN